VQAEEEEDLLLFELVVPVMKNQNDGENQTLLLEEI
jgi:hypothetical protein